MIDDISIPEMGPSWQSKYVSDPYVGYWYNANEMLLVADQQDTVVHNKPHLLVGKMNREGEIIEKAEINKPDTLFYAYGGMAYANDSTVYVTTRCHTESWMDPYYPCVYLVNTGLEVLGKIELWDELDYIPQAVFPTSDGGCVFCIKGNSWWIEPLQKVIRFSREDFNPIPCSVKEVPQEAIKTLVYPNPAKEKVTIDGIEVAEVQVYNALGQLVKTVRNSNEISVSDLPEGIYLLRITNSKGVSQTERITVIR